MRSASAMPTAVAMPWPSGPVVVSMAGVFAEFRVAGGGGMELAEALQRVDAHAGMAGEMQQGIEQHGAMAGGEHETVAVGPVRVGGVEFQEARPQRGGGVGHAHGHAGMAGFGGFDGVDGKRADGVRQLAFGRRGAGQNGGLGGQCRVVGAIVPWSKP